MYKVTGNVTAHYSTIARAKTGFSQVLTLSALKVIFMTFSITNPKLWYLVHRAYAHVSKMAGNSHVT
jgi:hypothetical protein